MASSSDHPLPAKVAGLAILVVLVGCAIAVGSLWAPWAVPNGWDEGVVPAESGWAWMAYGDVLLVVTAVIVVAAVVSICRAPARHGVALGIGSVVLLACAIFGALVVAALTTVTFADFDTVDYDVGRGPVYAVAGLLVAVVGVVIAMVSAAPRDRSPLAHPGWHLPHPLRHPHTHGM